MSRRAKRRRSTQARGRQGVRPPRKDSRWRYRRRRAILLLFVLGAGAAAVVLIADNNGNGKPATKAAAAKKPKLAARIGQLKRELQKREALAAQGNREAEAAPTGASTAAAPASFTALENSLPGQVGIAYTAPGGAPVQTIGDLQSGSAWSTSKVPLAARVIKDAHGVGGLSSSQRSLISSALTASDNAAAMELWDELVSRYGGADGAAQAVTEILANAGDTGTTVSSVGRGSFSPYGQTEWSLAGQARFMASLAGGCVPGSSYLLSEMSQVIPGESWGLGEAGSQAFKGGWGPGTDGGYLVRQMGTLPARGGIAVVAIAALPSDGQFSSGTEMLGRLAQWARSKLRPPPASGC